MNPINTPMAQRDQFRDAYEQARHHLLTAYKRDGRHFLAECKRQGIEVPPEGLTLERAAKALAERWLIRGKNIRRDDEEAAIAAFIAKRGVTKCPSVFLNPTSVATIPPDRDRIKAHIEMVENEPNKRFHADASKRHNRWRRGWRAQLSQDKKIAERTQRMVAAE